MIYVPGLDSNAYVMICGYVTRPDFTNAIPSLASDLFSHFISYFAIEEDHGMRVWHAQL